MDLNQNKDIKFNHQILFEDFKVDAFNSVV